MTASTYSTSPAAPASAATIWAARIMSWLVVTVTDPGARAPEALPGDPDRFVEGGRGLLVVSGVSDAWGWARLSTGGKAVWASFDLRVSPPRH